MKSTDALQQLFDLSNKLRANGFTDAAFICGLAGLTLTMNPATEITDDVENLVKKWAARSRACYENAGLVETTEVMTASDFSN